MNSRTAMAPTESAGGILPVCAACGKRDAKTKCSKCKMVYFCGKACQSVNWESHRNNCIPFREGVACCDVCKETQAVEHNCCHCGTLYCMPCSEGKKLQKCQGCGKPMEKVCCLVLGENLRALEKLVEEKTEDRRRGFWCIILSQMYREGVTGVEPDLEEAKRYAELGGSLGYGEGYNLFACFLVEKGEWQEGKEYWEKACDLQFAVAFTNMGKSFRSGDFGGNIDYDAAKACYEKGLQLGDIEGVYLLGLMHASGEGVPVNKKKAVKYYKKGANKGEPHCQLNLGCCYANGDGLPQSFEQARSWWEKAASQSDKREVEEKAKDNLETLSRMGY